MKIEENAGKILCDFGCCKNDGKYAIKFDGLSSRNNINVCENCLRQLLSESKKIFRGKYAGK